MSEPHPAPAVPTDPVVPTRRLIALAVPAFVIGIICALTLWAEPPRI